MTQEDYSKYVDTLGFDPKLGDIKKLSDVAHILLKPSIYIGSMQFKPEQELEIYDSGLIYRKYDAILCDGLNTMANELIANAYDVRVRDIIAGKQNPVNQISMTVNSNTGKLACWDNGGIPIIKHPEYNEFLPQLFFGHLRSGSNYVEDRGEVAGTNGVGASLVNVMSKQFKVITALNGLRFECTWHDNMSRMDEPIITKCSKKEHFTYIEAMLDLGRWKDDACDQPLSFIPHDTMTKWLSRAIEVAVMGCDEKSPLTVEFVDEANDKKYEFSFKHFWEYKDLWYKTEEFRGDETTNYSFEIGPSLHGQFESFAIVNSIRCDYGTHMDFIANVVADYIAEVLKTKHGIDITEQRAWKQQIFKQLSIMSMWKIPNPEFDAQIKDKLATPTKNFGFPILISDRLKKHLAKTKIVENLVDDYKAKQAYEAGREQRKRDKERNEQLTVKTKQFIVDNLVDASSKTNRDKCSLIIIEGESASQGLRTYRDALTQGFYCMKGKSLGNTLYLSEDAIMKKEILVGLMRAIGLKFGQKATLKNIRFGTIDILTDADVDGASICAMLVQFFHKWWPELFELGIIRHMVSPLIVVTKDVNKLYFYNQSEFDRHADQFDNTYSIDYKKGIASLCDEEFEDMMANPIYEQFEITDKTAGILAAWFDNDSNGRKQMMGITNELYTR